MAAPFERPPLWSTTVDGQPADACGYSRPDARHYALAASRDAAQTGAPPVWSSHASGPPSHVHHPGFLPQPSTSATNTTSFTPPFTSVPPAFHNAFDHTFHERFGLIPTGPRYAFYPPTTEYTDGTPTYTPTVPAPRPNYMPWPGHEVVPLGTHHVNSVHASAFPTKEEEATVGLPDVSYAPTVAHVQQGDGDIIAHPPYHDDTQPPYHDDTQPPYHDDSQPLDSAPYSSNMLPPADPYGHYSDLGVAVNTADYQPPAMGGYAQSAYVPDHAPAAHAGPYWTVPSSQVSGPYDAPYDEPLSPTERAVSPSAYDAVQPALETSISAPAVLASAPPSRPPSALPKVLRVDTVLASTARTLSAPPSAFSSGSAPDSSAPASPVSPSSGPQRERRSGKVPRFKHRPLACHFCRSRKIACGAPADGTPLGRCQQCVRRNLECVYPAENRRGWHKTAQKERRLAAERAALEAHAANPKASALKFEEAVPVA